MKRIFTIIATVVLTASMFAQSPEKMSYQAVIRDASNNLVKNTQVGMQISILKGSADGTPVYVETQSPTTNANGLVSIEIGTGTTSKDFSAIDWANGKYFIETETDVEGGTNYTVTGISQVLSVPYALHAKTAETITGTVNYTETKVTAGSGIEVTGTGTSGDPYVVNTSSYYLGQLIGTNGEDGVVIYVDHTGQHGLICSNTDIDAGVGIKWFNSSLIETGATSEYEGQANTDSIVADQGDGNYAAKICADYSTTGTSAGDWYLPSMDELSKIYHIKYEINKALATNSFALTYYWSSTENGANYAWYYSFINGSLGSSGKNNQCRVRAVRAF